jgi:hypothetical protein
MVKGILFALLVISSVNAGAAGQAKLNRLLSAEMLGVQRAYFEQISGVAKRVMDTYRQYDIGGCFVGIVEDKQQSILSIELEKISERCTFDAAKIFLEGPAHKLTFAKLNQVSIGGGAKQACLGLCGNAADPSFGLIVETPRALANIEYDAEVSYNDASEAAARRLQSKLEKRYPGVELDGDYLGKAIPSDIFTEMWLKEFRNVRITSIRFGYDIIKE